ncbi:MAG: phosphatase PAP2 family protein [Deltaproteobacteria bacterium]
MKQKWIVLLLMTSGAFLTYFAYIYWDVPIAYYCRGFSRSVLDIAEIVTNAGDSKWYFILFVPAFLISWFALKNRTWSRRMLFLVAAISVSGLISTLIKWIAGRNRPINLFNHELFGFNFFEVGYELNSFPSGHAVTAFSLAAALTILFPRFGILAFIPATAIALSRVVITAHYLGDIIAGAVVGAISTLAVKYVFDRFKIELAPRAEAD